MGAAENLYYTNMGWGDEEMVVLVKAFMYAHARGAMAKLEKLGLGGNQIDDEGMKSFSTALASGALPQLKKLWLQENKIGDKGMKAFSTAL
eukprot:6627293-Prymnesium_polylepis.1